MAEDKANEVRDGVRSLTSLRPDLKTESKVHAELAKFPQFRDVSQSQVKKALKKLAAVAAQGTDEELKMKKMMLKMDQNAADDVKVPIPLLSFIHDCVMNHLFLRQGQRQWQRVRRRCLQSHAKRRRSCA
jgi:hypothetical protein